MEDIVIKTSYERRTVHVSDYESGVQLSIFLHGGYACVYLDYGQAVALADAINKFLASNYQNARDGIESKAII